jgi:TetR/AcrR family transcriptional regulator
MTRYSTGTGEQMAFTRRRGVESSEIRTQLIDAAEQIIREQGCAALTARLLSEKVGLKRQIVHYYFGTIDDVFLAVIRRSGERTRARLQHALESDEPLRVMWREGHIASTTSLEFIAMAARNEAAKAEIKSNIEEFRGLLARGLERELELRGIKASIPATVVTIVMMGVSETLAVEATLGVSDGHAETKAHFEKWLRAYVERGELLESPATQTAATQASRGRRPTSAKSASRLVRKRR